MLLPLLSAPISMAASRIFRANSSPRPVIVGYVFPDGAELKPGQIDAGAVTRINYAFANLKGGKVVLGYPQDDANLKLLATLRRQNPELQILLSVGGWSWSAHFSDAALTEQSRKAFVQSAAELVERYDLDGLDIDWEYPDQPGAGNVHRHEDTQNFTLLMKDLRERFDEAEKSLHRRLYLTIAAGSSDEYLQKTQMDKVQNFLDAVNLMAYDYYMPGEDHITGNTTPLYASPGDPKHVSADTSIRAYERAGVPAAKIVLGVPFFGRAWHDVDARNHGLFQRGKTGADSSITYDQIAGRMLGHGFSRYWDGDASAPYLYSPQQRVFVSYEDPQSVAAKCQYVLENKLAGIMFWDYSDDSSGALLRAVGHNLLNPGP